MKTCILFLINLCFFTYGLTQDVGIGVTTPDHRLHIKSTSAALLRLENSTTINSNVHTDLYFNIGGYYTGAIKSIGTAGPDEAIARLGLFTYAGFNPMDLQESVSISDIGYVGIGDTTPTAPLTFANDNGTKVDLFYTSSISRHGIGVQPNLLQVYCNSAASDIAFGHGSSSPFTELMRIKGNGRVGIGTSSPNDFLSFGNALGDKINLWHTSATAKYGIGVQSGLLQLYTSVVTADIVLGYGSSTAFTEVMRIKGNGNVGIGTTTPGYILDVNGRMRLRHAGNTSGLWLMNSTNTADRAFVGMYNDTHVGFYGGNGGNWNLLMNTMNGRVGIGTFSPNFPLDVESDSDLTLGRFLNSNPTGSTIALYGIATTAFAGRGVVGAGRLIGVEGTADITGSGSRYGLYGSGKNGTDYNYGAYCYAIGGAVAYGIWASGTGGSAVNYAGIFDGDVYTTGAYLPSDRKLKKEIQPLNNALAMIGQLKPTSYTYKTHEYEQMQLPVGVQYGLIADEVMQILPGAVKKTILPAQFENHDEVNGRKIRDEVEFEAINYTQMIPVLIGAIHEQQQQINSQQVEIDELKRLVGQLLKK